MTRGMRKVRMGQQGTAITTLVTLIYMGLQWNIASQLRQPLMIDGLNLLGVTTAAVAPLLFAMGANVWTHKFQAGVRPASEDEESKPE